MGVGGRRGGELEGRLKLPISLDSEFGGMLVREVVTLVLV